MSDIEDLEAIEEGDDLDVLLADPPPTISDELATRYLAARRHALRRQDAFLKAWDAWMEEPLLHRQQVTERNQRIVASVDAALGRMMDGRREADPGLTRIELPGGTLKSKPQQPEWSYDSATFEAWARSSDNWHLMRPSYAPRRVEAKKALSIPDGKPGDIVAPVDPTTGEQVPGVSVTYRARKLVVES